MLQYLTFSNRIALERVKLYHKPPESHIIYEKVNPLITVPFISSALYNKRLILSLKIYKLPSFKHPVLINATSQRGSVY